MPWVSDPHRCGTRDQRIEEHPGDANTRGSFHERAAPISHLCDHEQTLRLPSGRTVVRQVVKHPGAVVILPQLADGRLLPIAQYRCAVGETVLEFPAGTLEPGEAPLACARRELIEETGYRADHWHALGTIYSSPGFCDERLHLFLASGLVPWVNRTSFWHIT